MQNNWKHIYLVGFFVLGILPYYISQNISSDIDESLTPLESFEKGNEAYEAAEYTKAVHYYESIGNSNSYSPEVFQNLGNAHYRLNHAPEAIYYFEKALLLKPGNEDLLHNIELANKRVVDKSNSKRSSGILNWISSSIGKSPDFWAKLTLIGTSLGVLMIGLTLLIKPKGYTPLMRNGGFISLFAALLFFCFAYIQSREMNQHNFAINFNPSVEIKNEPSESASSAFVLHEGSKMEILDQNKKWFKIQFNDQVGWIAKTDVKTI